MVAAARDRWQAVAVRRFLPIALFAVSVTVGVPAAPAIAGSADRLATLAQAPAGTPGAPRTMSFSWTLHPRMWAEVDLRFAADAEAVAEITAEGGEVSWNLHAHPVEGSPATFVVLAQGAAARVTVPCAPGAPGFYSYLFGNDRGAGTVRLRIELKLSGDVRLEAVKP
jgi:hypothetical protein